MSAPQRSTIQTALYHGRKLAGNPMQIALALYTAFRLGYDAGMRQGTKNSAEAEQKKEDKGEHHET